MHGNCRFTQFRVRQLLGSLLFLILGSVKLYAVTAGLPVVPPQAPRTPEIKGFNFKHFQPDCFAADSPNPLLNRESGFSGATWNDPDLIKVGDQYFLYASSDSNFNGDIKIYRWTSTDARNWTLDPTHPVFEASDSAGSFDQLSVETPSVVYFQNRFHLFYTGYNIRSPLDYKIGHATSEDGVHFERSASPLLVPSGVSDFRQFIVAEPGAIVWKNRMYLYFSAVGIDSVLGLPLQTIGLLETADAINWSEPIQVLRPDQTIFPRVDSPQNTGWYGLTTPEAIVSSSGIQLFVSATYDSVGDGSGWNMRKIHRAYSADGKSAWGFDLESIYERADFLWTQREIRSPALLLEGGSLRLWFAGDNVFENPESFGIGYSICQDPYGP